MKNLKIIIILFFIFKMISIATAENWMRFRGANGQGIGENSVPITWDEKKNILWRCKLPGPGSSSPVIFGNRVFVTSFSGVKEGSQDTSKLIRHVLCIDKKKGTIIWKDDVDARLPEDPYRGFLTEHGYASNTPVVAAESLFVYFGKSGVHSYSLDGKKLWQKNLGTGSTSRKWGSAASPIFFNNTLIVSAAEESLALYGLDPENGEEKWKSKADSLEMAYATPVIMQSKESRFDLVLPVPGELWGMNPGTGKLRWFAKTNITGNVSPSPVIGKDTVYIFGGYPSLRRCAIKINKQKGELSEEAMIWEDNQSSYVPTPVLVDGRLYWASDTGYACCADALSGEMLFRERLDARGKGSKGKPFYAGAVCAGGKIYVVSRRGGTFVFNADKKFELISHNKILSDNSQFHGTPAMSKGAIFLRSDNYLYCISE
ncbi:MAG: serine/threonine protein kinase [Verrucomicrobiaceae bacterium]|nr:serine/threonine protein kinase [Verrucomicrobiaceae bacterium]